MDAQVLQRTRCKRWDAVEKRTELARSVGPPSDTEPLSTNLRIRCSSSGPSGGGPAARIGEYVLLESVDGGCALRAVDTRSGVEVVCKVWPLHRCASAFEAYARVGLHPQVSSPLDILVGSRHTYVFFPRHYGTAHGVLRSYGPVSEASAATLFRQMVEAVAHCHACGLVLRDLKLRKFVYSSREGTKLLLGSLEDAYVLRGTDDSLSSRHACPAYVSPELLSSVSGHPGFAHYSGRRADMWSLGVMLYALLTGRYPFQHPTPATLFHKIRSGRYALPAWLSHDARCLLRCLLCQEPGERLTAHEVLGHPWLTAADARESASPDVKSIDMVTDQGDQLVPDMEEEYPMEVVSCY
uniref:tribbles homolog 3-like n=1 Tax=Myxine glutinosa TaxID=7769 RepID=UPI00358FF33A